MQEPGWLVNGADQERKRLSERTKAGQETARLRGKHIGRPERKINWKEFDKLRGKGFDIVHCSRVLDIPYSTLYRKVKERI